MSPSVQVTGDFGEKLCMLSQGQGTTVSGPCMLSQGHCQLLPLPFPGSAVQEG